MYETENVSDELTVFIMADKSDDIIDPQSSEKLHPDLHNFNTVFRWRSEGLLRSATHDTFAVRDVSQNGHQWGGPHFTPRAQSLVEDLQDLQWAQSKCRSSEPCAEMPRWMDPVGRMGI